jgi:FG-GAP-like repeat/Bacterial Ig domain
MMHRAEVRFVRIVALACLLPGAVFASTVSFSKVLVPAGASSQHADFNNDGREDIAYPNGDGGFDVILSTGDGSYAPPVAYTIPGGADAVYLAIGDFNSDGKADLIVSAADSTIHLFLNNGSGKFSQKTAFPFSADGFPSLTVGDFNHDGIMDVAAASSIVTVWFGNGKGGFTTGPTTPFPSGVGGDYSLLGDFDGDGNADIAFGEFESPDLLVFYGNSTGHFPKMSWLETDDENISFTAADVNGDGKMDLIGSQPGIGIRHVLVFLGNAARTWTTSTTIPTAHSAFKATAADVNGDGINDLIVNETDCGNPNTSCVGVLIRTAKGTYNAEQTVYSATVIGAEASAIRTARNTKPGIFLGSAVLLNTTSGNFPTCAPPNAFEGINVCSPAGGSAVASPVAFKVGAAGQVNMRKVEVWVDGKKLTEQLNGFSNYTFLNQSLSLAKGSHTVGIFAAGWDNSLEEKKFTVQVK